MTIKILGVVGARPNFMKIDPIFRELQRQPDWCTTCLVHTGQHYDENMYRVFFHDLGMRPPDIDLEVGSGSHAQQTGAVMMRLEEVLLAQKPELVIVVGDVNSTMAATITAAKLHIPVAHVEAGLRSYDRNMPEEINRIVTDALSSYLFTPSSDADDNLRAEGISDDRIFFVGNVMIDTLQRCLKLIEHTPIFERLGVAKGRYALLTLHRPGNVDNSQTLGEILEALDDIQRLLPIIFPIHPRTQKQIQALGFQSMVAAMKNLQLVEPLGYLDFLALEAGARIVLTDSGGIQEETTVLGVPCLTLRENTERPVTVIQGTNQIVGHDKTKIVTVTQAILDGTADGGQIPERWDGQAAARIITILRDTLT